MAVCSWADRAALEWLQRGREGGGLATQGFARPTLRHRLSSCLLSPPGPHHLPFPSRRTSYIPPLSPRGFWIPSGSNTPPTDSRSPLPAVPFPETSSASLRIIVLLLYPVSRLISPRSLALSRCAATIRYAPSPSTSSTRCPLHFRFRSWPSRRM